MMRGCFLLDGVEAETEVLVGTGLVYEEEGV